MTSVLNVDTIADKAGTGPVGLTKQSATKSWASLDSSGGSTTTLHGSFNVSSVLDDGVGQYGFNFINSMSGATYSTVGESADNILYNVATNWPGVPDGYTAGRTGLGVYSDGDSAYIDSDVCMQVTGDLA
jgi:hypothetical protein